MSKVTSEVTSEDYRMIFRRVMEYLQKDDVRQGLMSFLSDCIKYDIDLGMLKMYFLTITDKNELIKTIAGYTFMPDDIKAYYINPDKAFKDYPVE